LTSKRILKSEGSLPWLTAILMAAALFILARPVHAGQNAGLQVSATVVANVRVKSDYQARLLAITPAEIAAMPATRAAAAAPALGTLQSHERHRALLSGRNRDRHVR